MFLDLVSGELAARFLLGRLPCPVFIFLLTNFFFTAGDSYIDTFLCAGLLRGLTSGFKFLTIADL